MTEPPRSRGGPTFDATRSPLFAEHNDEVLRDVLGLSAAEISSLRVDGVIADAPQYACPPF